MSTTTPEELRDSDQPDHFTTENYGQTLASLSGIKSDPDAPVSAAHRKAILRGELAAIDAEKAKLDAQKAPLDARKAKLRQEYEALTTKRPRAEKPAG